VTEQPKTFPSIHGRCPACRGESLFIGTGGWVTCSRLECPNPSAADELLHGTHEVAILTARVLVAETELERLGAGEEPGGDPLIEPTPGQWIWQWNRATLEQRLNVVTALQRDSARGRDCFFMDHKKRLGEQRHAWVALARVRDVIADMENITGARHWARILRTAVDGEPVSSGPAATQATEPVDTELTADEARDLADELSIDLYRAQDALAFVGECCDIADREQQPITTGDVREWLKGARCGRQLAADATAHRYCILCGTRFQPGHTCDPAGLRRVYGSLVDRAERSHERAELLTATLREVLNAFTTARRDDGVIAGHLLEGAIHPDDMNRWHAVLNPTKEQPHV
jgi:hypothetical protein